MNNTGRFLAVLVLSAATAGWAKTELPLREVVLFTSGVGYFERTAEVEGAADAELSFKTEQIMDLIKSLVLIDEGGGRVSAVNYDSREPVERTLRSFSVDLTDNPSLGDLLNRLRGVQVRIKTGNADWLGQVVGVETREKLTDEGRTKVEEKFLSFLTLGIVRQIPLDAVLEFEIKDPTVKADFDAALKTLAGSLDKNKKGVRLHFAGDGKRKVRVGYMLEAPVWKTSYRLVLEKGAPLLQGWAHVENMTDDDWTAVKLSLVSGKPVSFVQNLYDPLYVQRPEVQNDLGAAVRPQEYEAGQNAAPAAAAEMESLQAVPPMAMAPAPMAARKSMRARGLAMDAAGLEEKADRSFGFAGQMATATAEAKAAGELFEYPIREPVTLPRRQSAMLPIVNKEIKGEKLSIYNPQVQGRNALDGVELENTSGLFLMQGPVTVFEDGVYAGDARLSDTQKGEKKLLSYAVDLASDVKVERKSEPEQVTALKIAHGTLILKQKYLDAATYTLKNKRDVPRKFLLEHPVRADWELVDPPKDVEKTRDLFRFRVDVEAGKARAFVVKEQRQGQQTVVLSNVRSQQLEIYLSMKTITPAVTAALKKLGALQAALQEASAARMNLERRQQAITAEQVRIRENMKTVDRNSETYGRWLKKLDQQESELDAGTAQIEKLRADELAKQGEINQYLASLDVE